MAKYVFNDGKVFSGGYDLSSHITSVNLDITAEELKEKSTDWISSKYQALCVIRVLETGDKDKVTDAITDIVNYAGSQSSISSVHLKVS